MLHALDHFYRAMIYPFNLDLLKIFIYIFNSLCFSSLFFIIARIRNVLKLPPGPWGLPFLGCLPWMGRGAPNAWLLEQAARYGDLTSIQLGSNLMVCIGSSKILRDLFNRPESIGRPHTPLNNLLSGRGIVLSEGLLWRKQRQFLHEKFRALGVNGVGINQRFQHCVIVEIEELLVKLESTREQPIDPASFLGRHVHNVICQLMMSFRFEEQNPEFKTFNALVTKGMELYGAIHIGEHLPAYLHLPGKKSVLQEILRNLRDVSAFHVRIVAERRRQLFGINMDNYGPMDLLDYYLLELRNNSVGSRLFDGADPDEQIVQVFNDLFSAGMETVRTSLLWALLMMVRNPPVEAAVRAALAEVLETGQLVTLDHRARLYYIEAVLYETLRIVSVVPLGTTHVNTSDWNVNGYKIPAGTHLVPLLNKINMDPELFPNPNNFAPERFISGGKVELPDAFIPFGVGRRVCLGEQVAKTELFLFFANIMNNFTFYLPEGEPMPELEGVMGVTHAPLPYKLCFRKI
ncbi:cytochrome P450 18a1-like [Leguminivora glycinivorella]|uniref:cytochrome P450 18a1-like n=1 Tax=Leguminivora glycinivorella TaxID=1035111 RepID=UPI00200F1DA2|nr:cytochrome P450 18a1-like [Leguminivora glycinivorella]